ncbi:extensin-like domain-containing protein [Microvirga roseola]|uniref:extensin-like domain-containing protein n=1 Tax=Microvirga roseola TaxID=2883126 RepID=UPI001E32CE79|nr:extensin family protein [Microvirga roseola]
MPFRLFHSHMAGQTIGLALLATLVFVTPGAAQDPSAPLPPARPDATEASTQKNTPAEPEPGEQTTQQADSTGEACLERLRSLGLRFESQPPVEEDACRIENPVSVSALPNNIDVTPESLMECSLAEDVAQWMGEVVTPEAERHLQSAPTRLLIGTSYQCRAQRSGGKLSEHAFGNGIDVMGFNFDKRDPMVIRSHDEGSPEAAFQSAIRTGACPIFTTVLGPGSDYAHSDHLHLDSRERKGDYRICQ